MQILGVCSWSLRPSSAADLAEKARATGLRWVQLHLDPIRRGEWDLDETVAALKAAGIGIASGMMSMKGEDYSTLDSIRRTGGVRPAEEWSENLAAAHANAAVAGRLRLRLVTFHAGFLPEKDRAEAQEMVERLRQVAAVFWQWRVRVALESGQETAPTLLRFLRLLDAKLPPEAAVGVNFDPANMILYGMEDPVSAAKALTGRIVQVHVKDAVPATTRGQWGMETPVGRGAVGWPRFLEVLGRVGVACPLMIERESGDSRVEDVSSAAGMLREAGVEA
jgi:L-ribulose-5-phosphate 3-epimerase